MRGFSKLGITLSSVFSLLLLALLAELLYLLWRRRQQIRRKSNRIEPTLASTTLSTTSNNTILGNVSSSHSEFLKFQGIYCPPSRVLFTIKEEDKDDLEVDDLPSSFVVRDHHHHRVGLNDHFGNFHFQLTGDDDGDSPEVIIMMGDSDFDVEPPFLTPCTSPPYFTPSPSPTREEKGGVLVNNNHS